MAWDVYSSDHKLETLAKDTVELATSVPAGIAGQAVGAAAATAVCTAVGITEATGGVLGVLGPAFVCLAGVVTGFAAAFVVGAAVGLVVDKILESGGKQAGNYVARPHHIPNSTEKLIYYVTPMPNGERLALQLAYCCP